MPNLTSSSGVARTRARYRTERIFRALCLGSIVVTGLFLAFLMVNMAIKAIPALTMGVVPLELKIDADKVDAADPNAGDYPAIVRQAMADQFPNVTERAAKKKLGQLISGAVSDHLQRQVTNDPSLIGKSVTVDAPLSADADMFLKGQQTDISQPAATVALDVKQDGDAYVLLAPGFNFTKDQIILALPASFHVTEAGAGTAKAEALDAPEGPATIAAGKWSAYSVTDGEDSRRTSNREAVWLETLREQGRIKSSFNWPFFTNGDSRAPEQAGIRGAFMGSLFTIFITLVTSLPLGVAAALYLEEFARKNRFTDLIEVNINNLAAVPSIIFGLLGLSIFLNRFGLPRSSPLVGGLVLALLVLPTIIIASRAALRSVPGSIKEAALGVGASHQQAVFQHVLPLAVPGILTGTILGIARALGETAPLLLIGMIAFIADVPGRVTEAATVLPVQIFLWSSLPEAAFRSRTALAIICLMIVLLCFNAVAIWLRNKFERRW